MRFPRAVRYGFFILIGVLIVLPLIGEQLGIVLNPLAWILLPIVNGLGWLIFTVFGIGMPGDGNVAALPVAGRVGIPLDAQTVTLNVAVTESTLPGFITVFPCGSPIPTAANLNYVANDTVSNSVIAKIGTNGTVCIYNSAATHIVVDVSGTLTT